MFLWRKIGLSFNRRCVLNGASLKLRSFLFDPVTTLSYCRLGRMARVATTVSIPDGQLTTARSYTEQKSD
jgi:hypothetical protein